MPFQKWLCYQKVFIVTFYCIFTCNIDVLNLEATAAPPSEKYILGSITIYSNPLNFATSGGETLDEMYVIGWVKD